MRVTTPHFHIVLFLGVIAAALFTWLGTLPPVYDASLLSVSLTERTWQYPISNWGFVYTDNYSAYSPRFRAYHAGEDFFLPTGTKVYAAAAGTVRSVANYNANKDYGGFVAIEHALRTGAKVVSIYGHLDPRSLRVRRGSRVARGALLGYLGASRVNGNWPPHLHFGIRKGAYIAQPFVYKGYYNVATLAARWYKPTDFIAPRLFDQTPPVVTITSPTPGSVVGNPLTVTATAPDPSGIGRVRFWGSPDGGSAWFLFAQSRQNTAQQRATWDVSSYADGTFVISVDACDRFTNCSTVPQSVTVTKVMPLP